MTRSFSLLVCGGLLLVAPQSLNAQSAVDVLQQQVRDLQRQVSDLTRRQAATDSLFRRVLTLLEQPNNAGRTAPTPTTAGCGAGQPSNNQWLQVSVTSCATLSPGGDAITFTLSLRNTTNGTLYIGATCCYPDNWLRVVDDRGQRWEGNQHTVTGLPTSISRNFVELTPGAEMAISATVRYTPPSRTLTEVPRELGITLSLLRRTEAEQRVADRAATAHGFPDGRPFSVGVTRVPVSNRS